MRLVPKRKIRKIIRQFYLSIAVILLVISFCSIYNIAFVQQRYTDNEQIHAYDTIFRADYQVYLIDNQFINEKTLPKGKVYVTDLIEQLKLELSYDYEALESTDIKYTYDVKAIMQGVYSKEGKDQQVLEREYILIEEKSDTKNAQRIHISENIDLDLKQYNAIIKAFEQSLSMSLDAKMKIEFSIKIQSSSNDEYLEENYTSNICIDLGKKTTEVLGELEVLDKGYINQNTNQVNSSSKIVILVDIIFLIISLLIFRYVFMKTTVAKNIRNEYKLELNKILRTCQDKIVQVSRQIDIDITGTIEVRDFGELIKLSEEISKPILCWIDKTKDEAWFCVISSKVTYRYILNKK